MRTILATLAVATLIAIAGSAAATATPTLVNVRIEGRTETLFEGPLWTEGRYIQASSDTTERLCNAINVNDPQNKTPGPTPTAASADAMEVIGEAFDGQWYPGYEDYFITAWGPDHEAEGMSWGVLVNNVFTSVGGCQYEMDTGDEALWVYNAFQSRPFLALLPVQAKYSSGPRPLTATAQLGEPFEVEVIEYSDQHEDTPPSTPGREGSSPFGGAVVSPVSTSAKGFEKVQASSAATVTTDAQGKTSITFTEPGWHRIKATAVDHERAEVAIRSNRLDVCVPAAGAEGCPNPFPEDQPRAIERTQEIEAEEAKRSEEAAAALKAEQVAREEQAKREERAALEEEARLKAAAAKAGGLAPSSPPAPSPSIGVTRVEFPTARLDWSDGALDVGWNVMEGTIGRWTIEVKPLTGGHGTYTPRASGTSGSSTVLKLTAGLTYELRMTITDGFGRSGATRIGKVFLPADDRWRGLSFRGAWRHSSLDGAWQGTVTVGGAGGRASARLGAGHAVFLLHGGRHPAKVVLQGGSHRQAFTLPPGVAARVTTAQRAKAGVVGLRVLQGTVDVDGVGVEP